MRVALVGPVAPADLADLMDPASASRASQTTGYRGIPVSELARTLVGLNHEVCIASISYDPEDSTEEFTGPGLRVAMFKGRTRPRHHLPDIYGQERASLSEFLRDVKPDIVHAHWTYEFELAAQDAGLPRVTTAHDAPFTILKQVRDPYRAARLAVALRARPGIENLSAVAPYLAKRWRREMRYRQSIAVIPNSIPTDALPTAKMPEPHPVVLEVADSSRRKNVPMLIRAHASVRELVPAAELRLVGTGLGPDDPMASWATQHDLAAGVTFVGKLSRTELAEEYSRAWLFAHASLEEACPMTLLEAHGAGLAILGGRASGGVPFVLGDGLAGSLTDVTNAMSFARGLAELISDGPPVPPPGAAAYIDRNFTPHSVAASYLAWYQRVAESRRRSG